MTAMNILNEVVAIKLRQLFGPLATPVNVEISEGFINFSLLITAPLDCKWPVSLTIYGIRNGHLECMMTAADLNSQLRIAGRLLSVISEGVREERKS